MNIRTHVHPEQDKPESGPSSALQIGLREGLQRWRHNAHVGSELSEPLDPQRDHVCGDPTSSVAVVEYGSYGLAGGLEDDLALRATLRGWLDDGRICLAFRHFPLIDSHPAAWLAALAVEAAGSQGRFWEMHDALMETLTRPWAEEIDRHEIVALARRLELDVTRLEQDMERASAAERIFRDFHSGVRSGVNGAPTFYVQGVRQDVDGAEELHARLESALAGDVASLWPPTHRHVDRHVEIARLWHDGFASGDVSASAEFWADDIDWRGWNAELPGGGAMTGKRAVEEMHRCTRPAVSDFRVVADEYIQHGDRVLVTGEASGIAAGRGFRVPYVQIWEMDDGKATRVHTVADTLAIARALDERAPVSKVPVVS